MGIAKGWSIAGLVILLAASFLQAVAQTSVTVQPTTSGNATVNLLLIRVINMDPNMLPVTAAPTPTGGVVPPRHCRPFWATSVSWNMNTMLMAVGMGSGEGYSGCPFSGPVQIFNMSDPARPRLLHTLNVSNDWVRTVAFNHDGTWLAVGGDDNKVRLYDPVNPSTPLATLSDAKGWIRSIDFNRDDTRLAVGSSDDQVRIYDMLNLPGVTYNISNATRDKRSVAYNHYGTLLAVGGEDEKVRIYRIGIRASATTSPSARPSTIKLATASTTISKFPSGNSTLIRHSSSYTTQPITSATAQPTTSGITNVRPLLIYVINIDPNVLPVRTAPTPTGGVVPPRHCGPHRVMSVSWNINSMLMAVGIASGRADPGCPHSGSAQIFDMSNPESPRLLHTLFDSKKWVRTVDFNHDGTRLAVGGQDKKVWIYDPVNPSTPLANLSGATRAIRSVKYNHGGTQLAVGAQDNRVRIYDPRDLSIRPTTLTNPYDWVMDIDYNHDDTLMAVAARDGWLRIYEKNLSVVPHALHHWRSQVRSVKFSHDGKLLSAGGSDSSAVGERVAVYDIKNLTSPKYTLWGARDWIMSIDINHDSTRLAAGSGDRRVRIYGLSNLPGLPPTRLPPVTLAPRAINLPRLLYTLSDAKKDVRSVEYNHDGTLLAAGAEDGKVRIYRVGIRASATTSSSARLSTSQLTTASSSARLSTSKLATTSTTISGAPSVDSTLIRHSSSYTALPDNTEAPSLPGSCPPPEGIPLFQAYDAKNEQIYVVIQPESHSKKVNLARYKGSELDKQFGLCGIVTYTTSDSRLKMLGSFQSLTGQVIHDTTGSQLVIVATATSGETVLVEFPLVAIRGGRAGLSVHNNVFPGGVQINDTAHHQGVMYFTGTINNKLLFSSYYQQRLRFPKKYYQNDEERGLRIRVSPDGEKLYVTGTSSDKNVSYPFFIRQYEKKELNPAASFGDDGKGILITTDPGIDNILQDILIQKNHVYVAVFNPESEKLSIRRFATDNGQMDGAFIIDDTIRFSSGTSDRFLTVRLVTAKNSLHTIIYNSNGQLSVVTYENQVNVHRVDTAFKAPARRSMRPVFVGNKAYLAVADADVEKGVRHVRMQVISLGLDKLPPLLSPKFPDWCIGLITAGVVVLVAVVSAIVAVKKFKKKLPVPLGDAADGYQEL